MSMPGTSTFEQIQGLRNTFRHALPQRVATLIACWKNLVKNGWSPAAAHEFHQSLHSLSGSAGTFGYPAVGEASREMEVSLGRLLETGAAPDSRQIQQFSQMLDTLRETALTEQPQQLSPAPKSTHPERGLVYLADDDQDFSLDTALKLRNYGYQVRIFSDPGALKPALEQERPAAILVDVVFNGDVLGTEAVQELRASFPALPPLVFVTVCEGFAARLGATRAGCSGYFTKPLDIEMLVDCLDRLTGVQPAEPYRILIVDDSRLVAATHALNLQQAGFETEIVTDPTQTMQSLVSFAPDLILMDLNMPECNGIELASVIRQQSIYLSTPIVFLSSETDRSRQLTAIEQGGDDFLTKPLRPDHLVTVVQARASRARALRTLMANDSMTGLLNHKRAKEQLSIEVVRAARDGSDLAVAMIDIDHFKKVNDDYGHPTGDRVIISLARLLRERLRTTDIIGRYGGEEFIAVLINTNTRQAREIIDSIRESFSKTRHHSVTGEFTCTFSCGIAGFPDAGSAPLVLDAADQALYSAKNLGRNCVIVANPD